jgi:hypothetical protein
LQTVPKLMICQAAMGKGYAINCPRQPPGLSLQRERKGDGEMGEGNQSSCLFNGRAISLCT